MLKIGDFSRLARVSVKTLRFYDQAGLFRPAWVEPRSGYRFYRAQQLRELKRIRLLRELGCSVEETAQLVRLDAAGAACAQQLTQLRRRLMTRLAREEERLRRLDELLHGQTPPVTGSAVREHALGPVSALTLRDRVPSVERAVQRMFESTERRIARHACRAPASPFLLFHDMEYREREVDVEVCVPIVPEALGACGGRVVPGAPRAACLRFAGSYAQAPRLYEHMLAWMDATGTRIAGPVRETYLRFGAEQRGYTLPPLLLADSVAEYETELQIPVQQL
ncbi:MAG TPA: MerR family transcriptional regulator [Steroidobacteraceae bacterium]|jgi:DNA-binding transcriptional MerR regulator/effector-binding domain-containing protein